MTSSSDDKPHGLEPEDYDDDEDEDDDDEEQGDSLWKDLKSAWKQHLLAIVVAMVATCVGYMHMSSQEVLVSEVAMGNVMGHEHTYSYQRMANISFCPNLLEADQHKSLFFMDFRVPLDLMYVLEHHYKADLLQDQDYSRLLLESSMETIHDPEYSCMKEMASITSQSFVKGFAHVYQPPTLSEIYQQSDDQVKPVSLSFTGFAAKFINLGPTPILLHWDGHGGHADSSRLVAEIAPFQSVGTLTTPGQSFYVSPVYDSQHALQRWTVTADAALVVYIPETTTTSRSNNNNNKLDATQQLQYDMQRLNLAYANDYLVATGRTWLANFPRPFPVHPMRIADYMGQQHIVQGATPYAMSDEPLTLSLHVMSVTPRVFMVPQFLSDYECQELMSIGQEQGMKESTVVTGLSTSRRDRKTRSSTNAWIAREHSTLTDNIYRRAADVLGMEESLFRDVPTDQYLATHNSIAESLQLVRYGKKEEYTAHHDFVHPSMTNRYQPTRFATLLLYLNDDFEGGETVFPRALNKEFHDGITVRPKKGMAVLFYNILPDGNMDDSSQHASKPVTKGEKWLANLWVWDPIID